MTEEKQRYKGVPPPSAELIDEATAESALDHFRALDDAEALHSVAATLGAQLLLGPLQELAREIGRRFGDDPRAMKIVCSYELPILAMHAAAEALLKDMCCKAHAMQVVDILTDEVTVPTIAEGIMDALAIAQTNDKPGAVRDPSGITYYFRSKK